MDSFVSMRLPGLTLQHKPENEVSSLAETHPLDDDVPDDLLLTQVRSGSREALAVLFRRYARTVRGIAFRVLRDPSEADDLMQDIFLLIYRLCRGFDGSKGSAYFWITQMTYRRAISRRRYLSSRHFYTRLELDENELQHVDPQTQTVMLGESAELELAGIDLEKLFTTLSEDQQKTLRLHFIEGYTLDEIAKMLGQSKGNIRHHSFRGLEKLRKQIFRSKMPDTGAV